MKSTTHIYDTIIEATKMVNMSGARIATVKSLRALGTNATLRTRYESIHSSGIKRLASNDVITERLLLAETTGISLNFGLDQFPANLRVKIGRLQTQLQKNEPGVAPQDINSLHMGVFLLNPTFNKDMNGTENEEKSTYKGPSVFDEASYGRYRDVIRGVLANLSPFEIQLVGICASPSAIFLRGFDNGAINQLRERVLLALSEAGLPFADRQPNIVHSTLARFTAQLNDAAGFAERVNALRETPIGSMWIDHASLIREKLPFLGQFEEKEVFTFGPSFKTSSPKDLASIATKHPACKEFNGAAILQAISAIFGIDEPNDTDRNKAVEAKVAPMLLQPQNITLLNRVLELIPRYHAWTASGAHRFYPLALAVTNLFRGKDLFDKNAIGELKIADADISYLNNTHLLYANPFNVAERHLPIHMPTLTLPEPQRKDSYKWLDIGTAPKAEGSPTLHALKRALEGSLPDKRFEIFGTDIAMPLYTITPEGSIALSKFHDETTGWLKPSTEIGGITYFDAAQPPKNIMDDTGFADDRFDFISICMTLHHLKGEDEEYIRLPFTSLNIKSASGRELTHRDHFVLTTTVSQQKVIDNLLQRLEIGGILFIDPHSITPIPQFEMEIRDENNFDMFFVVRRVAENEYIIYDDSPISFKPNREDFSPSRTFSFIEGYSDQKAELFLHDGIKTIYPGMSDDFYEQIQVLLNRSEMLAFRHLSWKHGLWGSATKAVFSIKEGRPLYEIFENYLENVPKEDELRKGIIEEVNRLHLQGLQVSLHIQSTLSAIAPQFTKGAQRNLTSKQRQLLLSITRSFWKYLSVQDPQRKADLIMALGSSSMKTPEHAAKLFHEGISPYILVSGGVGGRGSKEGKVSEARRYADRLIELGVPETAILLEEETKNTGTNISKGFAVLKGAGLDPKTIILVTRPTLQRRVWATALKQFPEIEYINSPAEELLDDISDAGLIHYFSICFGEIDRLQKYSSQGFTIEQPIDNIVLSFFRTAKIQIFDKVIIDPELLTD